MIKTSFSFSIIFSFLGLSAQEIDSDGDGVLDKDDYCPNVKGNYYGCPDPRKPDCTEFQKEKKLLFDKLKQESQAIDYSKLADIIFSKIDFKKFKNHNLLISLENMKGYDCGVPFMYECRSDYNVINPNFSSSDFMTEKMINSFRKKIDANIIPVLAINNFDNDFGMTLLSKNSFEDWQEFRDFRYFKTIGELASTLKILYKNREQEMYYFPNKKYELNIEQADNLMFDFKNELGNLVIVDIYYNKDNTPQTLKFQYKNSKWILL